MTRILVLSLVLLTSILASCNGGGSGGGGSGGGSGSLDTRPSSTGLVTAVDTRAAAKAIYDQVDSGNGFTQGDISTIFATFAIPTVASTNGTQFQANLDAGTPELLDFQAAAIAKEMSGPTLVSISDFVDMLNAKGAHQAGSSTPLTKDYLDKQFAPFVAQQSFQGDALIPAFVLALGRERAARSQAGVTDVVWGDGYLDPLQLNLLLYNMAYAPNVPSEVSLLMASGSILSDLKDLSSDLLPTLGPKLEKFAKDYPEKFITGKIKKMLEFPIGKVESAQVSLCASVVLYSYQLSLTTNPKNIYEQGVLANNPYQSDINANLSFHFKQDTNSLPKQIGLFLAKCHIPANGPAASKPITWELTQELPDHGSLIRKDPSTDPSGDATATYEAKKTAVPVELQQVDNLKAALGNIVLKAGNLLPGQSGFVKVVRFVKAAKLTNQLGTGQADLTVGYIPFPALHFVFTSNITQSSSPDFWDAQVSADIPLTVVKEGTEFHYKGSGTLHYDSFTSSPPEFCGANPPTNNGKISIDIPLSPANTHVAVTMAQDTLPSVVCTVGNTVKTTTIWAGAWAVLHASDAVGKSGYTFKHWTQNNTETLYGGAHKTYNDSGSSNVSESTTMKLVPAKP